MANDKDRAKGKRNREKRVATKTSKVKSTIARKGEGKKSWKRSHSDVSQSSTSEKVPVKKKKRGHCSHRKLESEEEESEEEVVTDDDEEEEEVVPGSTNNSSDEVCQI